MNALAKKINKVIEKHDEDLHIDELSQAVAEIIHECYGNHNFDKFIKGVTSKYFNVIEKKINNNDGENYAF